MRQVNDGCYCQKTVVDFYPDMEAIYQFDSYKTNDERSESEVKSVINNDLTDLLHFTDKIMEFAGRH